MRSPGDGNGSPIASYSGSYHPAPIPTSRRPPLMRSMVASALASTVAGRSASQTTSVPSRGRLTVRASAASVTSGSNAAWRVAGPPYFSMSRKRWSDNHSES